MVIEPLPKGGMSRETAAVLQGLLAVSVLMAESACEEEILHLASTSLPSVTRCKLSGFYCATTEQWKVCSPGLQESAPLRTVIQRQLAAVPAPRGPLILAGSEWGFAFALRGPHRNWGFLVVCNDQEPSCEEELLLDVLAQQTALALAIAEMVGAERETSGQLSQTNEALLRSVADLRRTIEIHARLDAAASSGEGPDGLARTLHELTGFPSAIEDRSGNLLAWAPGDPPNPYPKPITSVRERLLRDLASARYPKRHQGRVMALTAPRWDVVGTLVLLDPAGNAGKFEFVALEHAATVLAMELLRMTTIAEAELRLRRDLVEELLAGADDEAVLSRARALGHNLEQEHRVAIVHGGWLASSDNDSHTALRMARELGVGSLSMQKATTIILISPADQDWEAFRRALTHELQSGQCRIAVGSPCSRPSEFPRSYREARLAMTLQNDAAAGPDVVTWDSLGAYRILSSVDDVSGVERFVKEQLGVLLEYDADKSANLVESLFYYLEAGGNHGAAAHALAVHRNTLKYRLDRICDITGCDLSDPDKRFNLQLATKGWQLLKAFGRLSRLEQVGAEAHPPQASKRRRRTHFETSDLNP